MKPASTTRTVGSSVLQRSFTLAELLDMDSFREVCESYVLLFQMGFKVFGESSEVLIDVKGSGADFCTYLFGFPQGKALCTKEVAQIRQQEISENELSFHNCFTGLRYAIAPIVHEGGVIGKLVFGPYFPADVGPTPLMPLGEQFNPETASRLVGQVRKVQKEVVEKVVRNLAKVIEVMLYIGYKHALTSRMHVESVTVSYNELQEKNRALQESYGRLKELDRLKSNFLATVSHELRTPLTSIIGYSEMLLEGLAGQLSSEQAEYVSTIMEKGEQLLTLISSLLDFSKIESGSLSLQLAPINLVEIARSAVVTVLPIARKRGVSLELTASEDSPIIQADGDKIRQVLVNIVSNAVKFNRKDGKVSVRVGKCSRPYRDTRAGEGLPAALAPSSKDFVCVTVVDTGVGIPCDKLYRIFDSFYQVDSSSTREYGGTGLGLAISRSLVEAHEGFIEVESELGIGSTFTILLPVERGS